MKELLNTFDETKIFKDLLPYYLKKETITSSDKEALLQYSAVNLDLLGLIGLLTNNTPRILLGKICYDPIIREKCNETNHTLQDIDAIADSYMDVEHSEADEYVIRQVILKYSKNLIDQNGNSLK